MLGKSASFDCFPRVGAGETLSTNGIVTGSLNRYADAPNAS